MVQVKAAEADRFLARLDPAIAVFLIYGPDPGLVAERAAAVVAGFAAGSPDAAVVTRLDAAEIAEDPGRLIDEACAIPLFGGIPAIRIRVSGNRPIHAAVEALLADPPHGACIVLEAGDLKKGAPLRKLCESSRAAAAIPCYPDDARALDALITAELGAARLAIGSEARAALRGLLGGDRLTSRGELAKLALYAAGTAEITLADIAAVVGDAAADDTDAVVSAAAGGDVAGLESGFRRLVRAGAAPSVTIGAALRHFQALHRAAASVAAGTPPGAAAERAGMGSFGPRRAAFERQLTLWPLPALARAAERLDLAMTESRLRSGLGEAIAGEALIAVCRQAASLARRRA